MTVRSRASLSLDLPGVRGIPKDGEGPFQKWEATCSLVRPMITNNTCMSAQGINTVISVNLVYSLTWDGDKLVLFYPGAVLSTF